MACQQVSHQNVNEQNNFIKLHAPIMHELAVVMVPFPAHSHLNQLLHLAHILASCYQIQVHYAGPANLNRRAKLRYANIKEFINSSSSNNNPIQFHDFHLPPIGTNPSFLGSFLPTISNLRQPVSRLLQQLSTKVRRLVIVHDSLLPSVVQEAVKYIPNVEAYTFQTVSAFAYFFHSLEWETMSSDHDNKEHIFQLHGKDNYFQVPPNEGCYPPGFIDFSDKQFQLNLEFESGCLYNTSRVLESKYLELLEKRTSKAKRMTKQFAIGPLNPVKLLVSDVKNKGGIRSHKCLEWLDRQEKDSVMYISFGTSTSMSNDQVQELALGLEKSGQRFIWVLKNADYQKRRAPKAQLPQEFDKYEFDEKRFINSYGRGMVVRDWVPQLEILAHPSTGGFISHCGWGSCIESISMGVPMVAWPMHSDQPKNAVLVTRVLKVGLLVREWEDRAELVTSSIVADVLRKLLATEQGMEMRKRAKALGDTVRGSLAQGGVSRMEMDSFVAHISRGENKERQPLGHGMVKPSNMNQETIGTKMSRM